MEKTKIKLKGGLAMSIKGRFFAAAFDSEEKKFLKELDSFICSQKKKTMKNFLNGSLKLRIHGRIKQ